MVQCRVWCPSLDRTTSPGARVLMASRLGAHPTTSRELDSPSGKMTSFWTKYPTNLCFLEFAGSNELTNSSAPIQRNVIIDQLNLLFRMSNVIIDCHMVYHMVTPFITLMTVSERLISGSIVVISGAGVDCMSSIAWMCLLSYNCISISKKYVG